MGCFSIDNDYGLLLRTDAIPSGVLSLVNRDGRPRVPEERMYWPHPRFLKWHREWVFRVASGGSVGFPSDRLGLTGAFGNPILFDALSG